MSIGKNLSVSPPAVKPYVRLSPHTAPQRWQRLYLTVLMLYLFFLYLSRRYDSSHFFSVFLDRRTLIHHAFSCPYLNMRIQKLGLPHFLFVFVPLEFLLELTGGYPDIHSQAFTGQEQTSFVLCELRFNGVSMPLSLSRLRESDLGISLTSIWRTSRMT